MVARSKITENKGSILPMVLIIVTVLMVLGAALLSASLSGYKRTISQGNIDYASFASQSVAEQLFDYISKNKNEKKIDMSETDPADQYVEDMHEFIISNGVSSFNENVGLTNIATVRLIDMKSIGTLVMEAGKARITVGITLESNYRSGLSMAGNQKSFYKKDFYVDVSRFYLNSAITSVGDLMVDGRSAVLAPSDATTPLETTPLTRYGYNVNIRGHVSVYGTSPTNWNEPEQYYYGGIYAKSNSYLKIDGDAYCRSFVRAGSYTPDYIDRSRIDITQDAVAQGIQVFGNEDKLVVYGNAYTFDDVEMNGSDSVIAINGSFFGMSSGIAAGFHDFSSAIVNSATVHDMHSNLKSKNSRIVVNKDVFVCGTSWKLDDSGHPIGQIEDTSVAWDGENEEMYRKYGADNWTNSPDRYRTDYLPTQTINGYQNLFGIWPDKLGNIDSWLNEIDKVRSNPTNPTLHTNDFSCVTPALATIPTKINGYAGNIMSANNRAYFMNSDDMTDSAIGKGENQGSWTPPELVDTGENYLTSLSGVDWDKYIEHSGTNPGIRGHLELLMGDIKKSMTTNSCQQLIERKEPGSLTTAIEDTVKTKPGDPTVTLLDSVIDAVKTKLSGKACLIEPVASGTVVEFKIKANPTVPGNLEIGVDPSLYSMIVNKDPKLTLRVVDSFKGIIITNGRVIVNGGGVTITGAIVAAGLNGDDSALSILPNAIPKINSTNVNNLDNGDYAAVYFDGTLGGTSGVDFSKGRVRKLATDPLGILQEFEAQTGVNLEDIL